MKLSSEMLQNLPYFWIRKHKKFFFVFHFKQLWIFNRGSTVSKDCIKDISQSQLIEFRYMYRPTCCKSKVVARNEKLFVFSYSKNMGKKIHQGESPYFLKSYGLYLCIRINSMRCEMSFIQSFEFLIPEFFIKIFTKRYYEILK